MAFNYSRLKTKAQKIINKFGKSYTFTRTTPGEYNLTNGKSVNTESSYTKSACVFDYSDRDRADGLVEQGDIRLLAEGYDYQVGDKVTIDGDIYTILNISPIAPSETKVAVNLQARK
jgi:hypothetical protein